MVHKLKTTMMVFLHTILAFLAVFVAGFTFYTFWRPVIGHERYKLVAGSPGTFILVLTIVELWGLAIYGRWQDRRAFFAWVLPAVFTFHFVVSWGLTVFLGPYPWWAGSFLFLETGIAYSAGAALGAIVTGTMFERPAN